MGLRYDLSRLGSYEFERMIQSLVKGIEPSTIICGDGRDDGREFFVHDANFEVLNGKYVHGYTVGQAKYKSSTRDDDITWVKNQIRGEFEKFAKKKETHPEKIPETYLFFTNVVLTPVGDVGGRDKVEKFISAYRDLIPNIFVFGADDIYAMLDNNRNVARCYTSYILPGDVLNDLEEYLTALKNKKLEALFEYARQMFREDSAVHLEQAGGIADKSINIRNVYTDLEFKRGGKIEHNRIAQYIIKLSDVSHRRSIIDPETLHEVDTEKNKTSTINEETFFISGKIGHGKSIMYSHDVLDKMNEENIIMLGNAGQGKSTICQYICQIYRACLLKRFKPAETLVENYLHTNKDKALSIPQCERFPIMVSLKRYAAWINEQGEDGNHSVIGYLAKLIGKKTGETISVFDFRNLLSGFSWIFFFDGLDEVPASSNRDEVLNQINLFLESDLTDVNCDCVVVCTSRYQGYNSTFSRSRFMLYEIEQLSKPLCRDYIDLLLTYLEENSDLREQYRRVLWESLEDSTVSKLMTTPLYTAIIVLLVKVGGTPPKKRYDLFKKYCEVVITREQQKQLLPQVNEGYEWIGALHGQIGFLLQLESESANNAAAEMPKTKCLEIINEYLIREEESNTNIHDIYNAMVTRLPFLAEVIGEDGKEKVVFPLRSIQEYFAAEWIIDFTNDETRRKVLEMISVSAYWRNVYLFINGSYATRDRNRIMNDVMFRICQQNNGDATEVTDAEVQKIVLQGSWLALDVLQDEPFNRPRDWHGYIEIAAKLLECDDYTPESAVSRFLDLPRRYENWLLKECVIPIIKKNKNTGIAFKILWGIALRGNDDANSFLETIIDSVILSDYSDIRFLIHSGYSRISKRVLHKLLIWVTKDCFDVFSFSSSDFETEKEYWGFLTYCKHELKDFDIESLYLRQACYRILNIKLGERQVPELILKPDLSMIERLEIELLESDLSRLITPKVLGRHPQMITSSVGVYSPLNEWTDPLSQYRSFFIENGFLEVVAMIDFLHRPTYSSFKILITAISSLSKTYQHGFFNINEWNDYIILSFVYYYFREKRETSSITEKEIKQLYVNCTEADWKIREYLEKDDYNTLIKEGYLKYFNVLNNIELDEVQSLEILDVTDEQLNNFGFIRFIYRSIFMNDTMCSEKIWEWGKKKLPFIANHDHYLTPTVIMKILEHTSEIDWINNNIQFPSQLQKWSYNYYYGYSYNHNMINRFFYLSKGQDSLWKFYSIVPFIQVNKEELQSYAPDNVINCYQKLKDINNQAAMYGFLICLLSTDYVNNYRELIMDDLIAMLRSVSVYSIQGFCHGSSMEGIKLIWKLLSDILGDEEELCSARRYFSNLLIDVLERKTINSNLLLNLSIEGHTL